MTGLLNLMTLPAGVLFFGADDKLEPILMQMSRGHLPDTGWTVSSQYVSVKRKRQSSSVACSDYFMALYNTSLLCERILTIKHPFPLLEKGC